jgi:2-keto-4-pentenoate hydratase/2-oxohepta-3-ene-1,7-dioic acid hydratase in catechol pathway
MNNSKFGDFVDHIYPIELYIKINTDTDRSASYLDMHLKINSDVRRNLTTNEMIIIFPF